jgi:hypothetical protein
MSESKYVRVPVTGTITLSVEDLAKELEKAHLEGIVSGRDTIIRATVTILDGKGDLVTVDDKIAPVIREYIDRIKSLVSPKQEEVTDASAQS